MRPLFIHRRHRRWQFIVTVRDIAFAVAFGIVLGALAAAGF